MVVYIYIYIYKWLNGSLLTMKALSRFVKGILMTNGTSVLFSGSPMLLCFAGETQSRFEVCFDQVWFGLALDMFLTVV